MSGSSRPLWRSTRPFPAAQMSVQVGQRRGRSVGLLCHLGDVGSRCREESTPMQPVDKLTVHVVVDNTTDMLSSRPGHVTSEMRVLMAAGMTELAGEALCSAHHGLSLVVTRASWRRSPHRTLRCRSRSRCPGTQWPGHAPAFRPDRGRGAVARPLRPCRMATQAARADPRLQRRSARAPGCASGGPSSSGVCGCPAANSSLFQDVPFRHVLENQGRRGARLLGWRRRSSTACSPSAARSPTELRAGFPDPLPASGRWAMGIGPVDLG